MFGEPQFPAGNERAAFSLADQDAVKMAAGYAKFRGGEGRAGIADQAALRLVGSGGHGLPVAFFWRVVLFFLCVAASGAGDAKRMFSEVL